ncbi:DEAD/DEAH box helicase family protein [Ponticoccus sp. SC2-23]|uniref:EcoAI/FtnUII family type I restriction enzme subunit R n=1 Tax=Alexandriicola marinus TaxID=2081710 RepID=UPI000FDAF0C2|nr:DEAD/DEAH box helicase family protein [Alexandriicola marinus]MBM1222702.1 DEAD/DEAH box helicase family protein [Ponticoccus sp. SC6-9]MBM1231628.1 DEAD/DEAH box helicase family protein [Ponticoccus sp. SC6-38]MBM1236201.1 DEAD/DEAH box helicase family protein [Ponticoccus sp. SC6-45]MBM1240651.1 DEAD/DEAH box helicase family protein [Ponticoccus sp. SC6-49]MBM1245186.1 DEAD/DEAH box helicase family protein [Ponticoccus sp. SC2-64]MBM1249702.1 DEAD/DEAH box helicase family protein [Pontic
MDEKEKKKLSESDICDLFISPAIRNAGWEPMTQIRREVTLTPGPVVVRGNMSSRNKKKKKFADYVLSWEPSIPIGVVEAKDNNVGVSHGMQQALGYAGILEVPSAFSSNGDAFSEHNKVPEAGEDIERVFPLNDFPSPDVLWKRYKKFRGIEDEAEELVLEPYHEDSSGKEPRYYQVEAINRTIEAIARGQDRVLLVMATGTGKTYTTFQIIWRLWKAGEAKRILFLADRNVLVDQTLVNDFKPFGSVMTKIRNRKIDPSYEIHLGLYQALTGPDESDKIFKSVSPDFFDLIVIDECHRGSAAADAAWREILEYFSNAAQIGLTATPKETKYVSSTAYFGEAIYTYSLKQGIDDGFLAPYKVVKIDIDRDIEGWTPPAGMTDDLGAEIDEREYNRQDMDRILVLNQRTKLVAERVMQLLNSTDPFSKTIIFCEDIDHAERMRKAIVNAAGSLALEHPKYVMRITGDSVEGKAELDNFIDPESKFPVIATTSELLTTGVDAKTCKVIVLDKTISSMTTFKQIIGRGTRIDEEHNKYFFTIMDFKGATDLFRDPDFDGDPVVIYTPGDDDDPVPPDPPNDPDDDDDGPGGDEPVGTTKIRVSGVDANIIAERIEYLGPDGNLITESYKDFAKKQVRSEFASLDDFIRTWNDADKKQAIIEELEEHGVLLENLAAEVGKDVGDFDLLCHIAFEQPPLTRKERANNVKKRDYFTKYGEQARAVLSALLDKYADEGITTIESAKVLKLQPFDKIGTPMEIINDVFGGKDEYERALKELEEQIYRQVDAK